MVGASPRGSFAHDALVYDDDADYVARLAPALEAAAARGEDTYAVVPRRNTELLRSALAAGADTVGFLAAEDWYVGPTATIGQYDELLRGLRPGGRAFVVGEVQFGATERQWAAWTEYESVLNRALERYPVRIVCPYDARTLPASVVADARRTHRHLVGPGGRVLSATYVEPEVLLAGPGPGAEPERPPEVVVDLDQCLHRARERFAAAATAAGFPAWRVDELTLAMNEVLTNALMRGGGQAQLRVWLTPGEELTCIVEDDGPGCDDVLLGYRPPEPGAEHGYGLWLARQIFDTCSLRRPRVGGLAVLLSVWVREGQATGSAS